MTCLNCPLNRKCPCGYSCDNAACITIRDVYVNAMTARSDALYNKEPVQRDPLLSIFEDLEEDDETRWAYDAQLQMNEISCEIVKFRTNKGWSQKELADYLGVPQSMIAKYESGDYNFTIESLNRLASKIGRNVQICISGFDMSTE